MYQARLLKQHVLHATNTWPSMPGKMPSICELGFILSMFCGSTRCFPVPGPTGFKREWGVPSVSHRELVPEWALARFFSLCAARTATVTMLRKLYAVLSLSFLVDRRSSSAGSGMYSSLHVPALASFHRGLKRLFFSYFRGFTKFSRTDYVKWKAENRILPDGVNAKVCYLKLLLSHFAQRNAGKWWAGSAQVWPA